MNFLLLIISLIIITFFLYFQFYYQDNTAEFFILNFIITNLQLLFLSNNIDDEHHWLQNINAENIITNYNNNPTILINNNSHYDTLEDYISIGAWAPLNNSLILEQLNEEEQKNAIQVLRNQGFHEYYFPMNNFQDRESAKLTERLLKSAEQTTLKIIIILRPPSEGNSDTNYDWKGWIKYFNSLEMKYPNSFEGFTIDDFNWISTRNDTKFVNNIDFMEYSNLRKALDNKDKDIKFYPTTYFEGIGTEKVSTKYDNFIEGLVVASGCYYDISILEKELTLFSQIFEKPIKYVIYPTVTYNYSKQGYNPPTDSLIQATLSIAYNLSTTTTSTTDAPTVVQGLVIWHDIDNPVIHDYITNKDNKQYLSEISNAKKLQIREENQKEQNISNTDNLKKKSSSKPDIGQDMGCQDWSTRYNKAYDVWKDLSQQEKEKNKWKKEILQILRKEK